MFEIMIGERKIPLMFTTYEMIAIQRDIGCTASELRTEVFGIEEDENDPDKLNMTVGTDPEKTYKLGTLLRILGNAGLEENGEEANLTTKWVLRHMKPVDVMAYAVAAMSVILDGMRSEVSEMHPKDESIPVDEILEAENEKKEPGN